MKVNLKKKIRNYFSISFYPHFIFILLIGLIFSFLINFNLEIFNLEIVWWEEFFVTKTDLYKKIILIFNIFLLFLTLMFFLFFYKILGFFIFLVNFLFLSICSWVLISFFNKIFLSFYFISFSFFYFGIYLQIKFLTFFKNYKKNEVKIWIFLKFYSFKFYEIFKYYFLIILFSFVIYLITKESQESISFFFDILLKIMTISIIIQFILFFVILSFFFYFFDIFVKKGLIKMKNYFNFFEKNKIKINNFKNHFFNIKFWLVIFLIFFILAIIIFIFIINNSIFPSKSNFTFKFIEKISLSFTYKIIFFSIICSLIYFLFKYKIVGFVVYLFSFIIKIFIIIPMIYFFVIYFDNKNILINNFFSIILFVFFVDLFLINSFLNSEKKIYSLKDYDKWMIKSSKIEFDKKWILFFGFINIIFFIELQNNWICILFFFLPIIFLSIRSIEKIFFYLIMKLQNKITKKFQNNISKIKFTYGKEEEVKGLNE